MKATGRPQRLRRATTLWEILCALLWAVASLVCPNAHALERPPWASSRWPYRKLLLVRETRGRGAARAWVHLRLDADYGTRALRVTDPRGRPVSFGVVHTTEEGQYLVAFETPAGDGLYAVYYGNSGAEPAELQIPQQGLRLETYALTNDAETADWAAAQQALQKAELQGMDYWPQVFDGHNPFGPQHGYAAVYTGYVRCPRTGSYRFATASEDSSYLFIDGELVVQWTGRHNIWQGRRGEQAGSVRLREGVHSFRYVCFVPGGQGRRLAAWAPPGKEHVEVIPADALLPLALAQVYETQRTGAETCADFRASPAEYLEVGSSRMTTVQFSSLSTGGQGLVAHYAWDFGDGQTSDLPAPRHAYMAHGVYQVTLSVRSTTGQSARCTKRLKVGPLWSDLDFRAAKHHRFLELVSAYRLKVLPTDSLFGAWELFRANERPQRAAEAARLLLDRGAELEGWWRFEVAMELAAYHQEKDPNPAAAEQYLRTALEAVPEHDIRRRMKARYALAEHHYVHDDDPERARRELAALRAEFPDGDAELLRRALIRIGDTHRRQGNAAKALEAYRGAGIAAEEGAAPANLRTMSALQQAEFYLSKGQPRTAWQAVRELLWQYPALRLDGRPLLLEVRAQLMLGRFQAAARHAETYLNFAADPNILPHMHIRAAEAHLGLGNVQKAREHYVAVLDDYPEAPEVQAARDGLDWLSF